MQYRFRGPWTCWVPAQNPNYRCCLGKVAGNRCWLGWLVIVLTKAFKSHFPLYCWGQSKNQNQSKDLGGKKSSQRLILKCFFSWCAFTNFHSFLIFPKGARANCISSYLFKVSRVWFGKIQYVFNIFPREYRCMFGTVPWFGGKYEKCRDMFVFSYFSFTSLQWPFYREIPYKKKLLLLYQLLALKL